MIWVPSMSGADKLQVKAKTLVLENYNSHRNVNKNEEVTLDDLIVVWFVKTLGNWKALVATNRRDGLYYEVTHNGVSDETYIDIYNKIANVSVPGVKT